MLDPRVLHVRSTLGMYGAEKVLLNLSRVNDVIDSSFYLIEGKSKQSSTLREKLDSLNVSSIQSSKRFDMDIVKGIREFCKKNKISVIHTHDYKSLIHGKIATLFSNVSVVHHIHGALGNTKSEKIYALVEKIFMLFTDRIITVSQTQKNSIRKNLLLRSKVYHVNNGTLLASCHEEKVHDKSKFSLVMVARFTPEKNHYLAMDIVKNLLKKGVNIELNLLGDGECMQDVFAYSSGLNISGSVKFIGFKDNVNDYIRDSDALLITSKTEGLPMSMLEAMALGVPVISTPVGEIPYIIEESNGGFIANNASEFINIIERLYKDLELTKTTGKKARAYLEQNLSVTAQSQALGQLYSGLVNPP